MPAAQLKPRMAYLILAINIGVYAAGLVAGLGPGGADAQQDYFLALAKTDAGVEAGEYYRYALLTPAFRTPAVHSFSQGGISYEPEKIMLRRLITGNFVHDSFVHLAGSSYALATVCPAIEEILGWDIFLAVYLMSALGGSVATFTLGDALTVGASSGIFGLIGEIQQYCRDIIVMPYCGLQCSSTKTVLHHMDWRQCRKTLSRLYRALGLHELSAEVYTHMPPLSRATP